MSGAFALCLFLPALARATCGAEGCPIVRDGLGAPASRFAFDLRYQNVTQDQVWNGTSEADIGDATVLGHYRALPLTASVLARWNTKGTDDYEVGDEVQAGLSGGYAPLEGLTLLAQVNYAGHGNDVSADATEAAHSAVKSLYVTPGLTVRVSQALSLYALYQMRAWGKSDEPTVVGTNHVLLETSWSLR